MKIALVSPYTLPVCRGNSLMVQRLFDGLRSRGHSVRLFNSTTDVPEGLASFDPDLIHSLHARQPQAWLFQSTLLEACPWVVTMTGTDYNSEMQSDMQTALSAARALIVFHAEAARSVQARFPELASRVHVIPQAVEVPDENSCSREEVRSTWNLSFEELVFFMAAGLRPVKNIGYALEAFARFRQNHPGSRLLLAGPCLDTQESDRVLALGKSIDGFEYCGELPHTQVLELMSAADIFLNTSLNEGMPGAVMEAMAARLAVIATDVTGNRALIESMRTGILVPLQAPEALLGACETLAADARLRLRLGDEARRFVSEHFCCETELQAHDELYASVLTR